MLSDYKKDLVWQLSLRGVPDERIREAIYEVGEHEARGEDPAAELGAAADFARTFVNEDRSRTFSRAATLGGFLAIIWLVGIPILIKVSEFNFPLPAGFAAILGAFFIMCMGVGVGFIAEILRARRTTQLMSRH